MFEGIRFAGQKSVRQVAALPFVITDRGIEVLLITSRRRGRWVVPKGWPMKGRAPWEAAAIEAHEEAGVVGLIDDQPLGSFTYEKRMRAGYDIGATVHVYPLLVNKQLKDWRERKQRRVAWYPLGAAVDLVDDRGLSRLIAKLARRGGSRLKDVAKRLRADADAHMTEDA